MIRSNFRLINECPWYLIPIYIATVLTRKYNVLHVLQSYCGTDTQQVGTSKWSSTPEFWHKPSVLIIIIISLRNYTVKNWTLAPCSQSQLTIAFEWPCIIVLLSFEVPYTILQRWNEAHPKIMCALMIWIVWIIRLIVICQSGAESYLIIRFRRYIVLRNSHWPTKQFLINKSCKIKKLVIAKKIATKSTESQNWQQ